MIIYILGTVFIAYASAGAPPVGGSLEDLIHEIFTPPPDLNNKGNNNPYNEPGVIGPVQPQQPQIEINVSAHSHM